MAILNTTFNTLIPFLEDQVKLTYGNGRYRETYYLLGITEGLDQHVHPDKTLALATIAVKRGSSIHINENIVYKARSCSGHYVKTGNRRLYIDMAIKEYNSRVWSKR